jgi:hypothetical protein
MPSSVEMFAGQLYELPIAFLTEDNQLRTDCRCGKSVRTD